ncbi:uncharacterized protein LOC124923924 [Impatiens glandulifera]|uniref:uncharacterized protein LOC124923924 n=1 Tax=Impatiens glandulifera TaxID=253017 RepID=UPI001FB18AC5|nr:uncharacterized protein LOC124923924 [Impatiens glandulifera]
MESTDASDGPVINFVNKRIRGLRKKLNRILQIEESIDQGKPINREQEELIRSKPSITASIDELEKLRQPLSAAVAEEVALAIKRHQVSSLDTDPIDAKEKDKEHEEKTAESQQKDRENLTLEDILNLLYFGAMFDVKSQNDFTSMMFTQMHERGSCLTYDYVTDDESADLLVEKDLDLISKLSGLLISRPVDSSLSHKNALQHCVEHAKLWLANSDQPIDSFPSITYAGLRAKLNKIMASDYFTTTPKMKPTAEMAADAAANFGSYQVAVPVQVGIQDQDGVAPNVQGQGNQAYGDESGITEESQKVEVKEVRLQTEVEGKNEGESNEEEQQQQYGNRRGHYNQNQRGGRVGGVRRGGGGYGRGSGRGGGGGPYQNGGRSQFYDQPGNNNYYPRNHYNNNNNNSRPRGGGGRTSYNNNNHGAGNQTRYVQEEA